MQSSIWSSSAPTQGMTMTDVGGRELALLLVRGNPRTPAWPLTLGLAVSVLCCGSRTGLTLDAGDGGEEVDPEAMGDASCLLRAHQTHGLTTDLYFLFDKSSSMSATDSNLSTRWESVSTAMNRFLSSPDNDGLGVGIGFFPISASGNNATLSSFSCEMDVYSTPAVPVQTLPQAAHEITAAIEAQTLTRGTPTTPALRGAYAYATQRQKAVMDHEVAVVVVTDGLPTECNSTIENASAAASAALAADPAIATYVLGVGPSLSNLNAIARAGGTQAAYLVDSGGVDGLTAALNAIRANGISCEFSLTTSDGAQLDYDTASLGARVGTVGTTSELVRVADASQCSNVDGGVAVGHWYYDDPSAPKKIRLCSNICRLLSDTPGSYLDVCMKSASAEIDE